MGKFNLSEIKKQAQIAPPTSAPASVSAPAVSQTGQTYDMSQQIISGTMLSDFWGDQNKVNQMRGRQVILTDVSAPLIFLGPDASGSGMATLSIQPAYLKTASGRNIMKKQAQMGTDNSEHIDTIANALAAMGLRDEQIDKLMNDVQSELKNDGWGFLNKLDNSNLNGGSMEDTFKKDDSAISLAIAKISKVKNIEASKLEAFEADENNIIVAELNSDRVFKVAKSALDKKFDKCVDDVKAKGGKGAKNPYAICMESTGKGDKKKKDKAEKKASKNPFIKK